MNLLQETKEIFSTLRSGIVVAMQKLYEVNRSEAWKEVSENWGDYVEGELGISHGFASKLLTTNRVYLVEGGLAPEKLEGIDYEKLYMARELPGSLEEKLEKARTLTRRELKEEKLDEEPHEHQPISICKVCQLRLG